MSAEGRMYACRDPAASDLAAHSSFPFPRPFGRLPRRLKHFNTELDISYAGQHTYYTSTWL